MFYSKKNEAIEQCDLRNKSLIDFQTIYGRYN